MRTVSYRNTFILGLKQLGNYRLEVWIGTFTRFIGLAGLLFLWVIIYKENTGLNVREIISYLLVANSVRDAMDAQHLKLSKEFIMEIKQGTISSHLLRPINTKLFFYFRFFGGRTINIIFDLFLFTFGLGLNPPKNVLGLVLFLISVVVGCGLAYCFNVLVGMLAFWTTEASGFRNVANHIIKVFSGSMIPISYFPETTKQIILMLPFPVLSYLPATFISASVIQKNDLLSLLISILWLLVLVPSVNYLWVKGVKDYDAAGI